MNQADLEKYLKRKKRELLDAYLHNKRPFEVLPRLIAQLTEGEREKFFKLFPTGIDNKNMHNAVSLCERTLKKREKEVS